MPLFFQIDVDKFTRLAIWKIEEAEDFFLAAVPLQREITHPHKRLQHLAGRYLLRYLFPDFPTELIRIADTRKPFLEDEAYHFSISHCGDYAAVIVSKTKRVGIDIELVTDKVARIQHKFLSADEMDVIHQCWPACIEGEDTTSLRYPLIMMWSCKEAVFKWFGWGNVDFRQHMQLQGIKPMSKSDLLIHVLFKKNEDQALDLHSRFFDNLCLSYVVT